MTSANARSLYAGTDLSVNGEKFTSNNFSPQPEGEEATPVEETTAKRQDQALGEAPAT